MLICPYMYKYTIPLRRRDSTFLVLRFLLSCFTFPCFSFLVVVFGKAGAGGGSPSPFGKPENQERTKENRKKTDKTKHLKSGLTSP